MKNSAIGYTVIIALLVITSLLSLKLYFRQRSDYDKLDIHAFPYVVGNWQGKDLGITEREYEILETRNLISREYLSAAGEKIYLFIVYSETNRSVFHPPEVCLIGSGITIQDKKLEKVDTPKGEVSCNKLYLERDRARDIALYCYKAGNFYTDNYYLQQALFSLNQLAGKQKSGATIRVSMAAGESEEETLTRLKGFMKDVINKLEALS